MFRYIRAMSIEKSKIITRMNTSSDTLMEHIVKVVVYNSQRQQDVNGWKKTCARILAKTGTYNAKIIYTINLEHFPAIEQMLKVY